MEIKNSKNNIRKFNCGLMYPKKISHIKIIKILPASIKFASPMGMNSFDVTNISSYNSKRIDNTDKK